MGPRHALSVARSIKGQDKVNIYTGLNIYYIRDPFCFCLVDFGDKASLCNPD